MMTITVPQQLQHDFQAAITTNKQVFMHQQRAKLQPCLRYIDEKYPYQAYEQMNSFHLKAQHIYQ